MTTLRECRRALKDKTSKAGLVIAHRPGFVDRREIDRGYTILSLRDAVSFTAENEGVTLYEALSGRQWSSPYPLADVVAARIRTGEPVE